MNVFVRAFKLGAASEPCKSGYIWFAWGVIGGLVPLWGTALLLLLLGRTIEFYDLMKNGEFVLYAASFIGGSLYIIRRDVFPSRNLLSILFGLLLAVALLTFAAIFVTNAQNTQVLKISEETLTIVSIVVLAAATLLSFVVTIVEASGAGFDVPGQVKADEEKLQKAFQALMKAENSLSGGANGPGGGGAGGGGGSL